MSTSSTESGYIKITPSPRRFGGVLGNITRLRKSFEEANPSEQPRLSVKQDYSLQQAASKGIFNILVGMNAAGSRELLGEFEAKTADEPFTDLVAVETDHWTEAQHLEVELEALRRADEESEDWDEETEAKKRGLAKDIIVQERYARLAGAVGATARSTVAAMSGSNPEAIQSSIDRARQEVAAASDPELNAERLGSSIGSSVGATLDMMLDRVSGLAPTPGAPSGS